VTLPTGNLGGGGKVAGNGGGSLRGGGKRGGCKKESGRKKARENNKEGRKDMAQKEFMSKHRVKEGILRKDHQGTGAQ